MGQDWERHSCKPAMAVMKTMKAMKAMKVANAGNGKKEAMKTMKAMKAMKEAKAKGGKKKEQESFVEKWVNFDTKGVKEVLLQIWIKPTGKIPRSKKIRGRSCIRCSWSIPKLTEELSCMQGLSQG